MRLLVFAISRVSDWVETICKIWVVKSVIFCYRKLLKNTVEHFMHDRWHRWQKGFHFKQLTLPIIGIKQRSLHWHVLSSQTDCQKKVAFSQVMSGKEMILPWIVVSKVISSCIVTFSPNAYYLSPFYNLFPSPFLLYHLLHIVIFLIFSYKISHELSLPSCFMCASECCIIQHSGFIFQIDVCHRTMGLM